MVKDTQTIRRLLLTNCLSMFDHFEHVKNGDNVKNFGHCIIKSPFNFIQLS